MRWAELPLQQVAEVVSGFGFPKDYQGDTEGEYPFLKVSDMNLSGNEVWMYESTNTISQEVLSKLGAKVFPPGTVIFPKIGAAIATGKKRILFKPSTFDNNVMGLVPKAPILALFLYYWSLTFDFQDIANIGPVPSLRKTTVEKLPILLPPISEQRRIVEILDQADVLRKKRAEADEKSDRILPALFIKMFGDPLDNPKGLQEVELGKVIAEGPQNGLYKHASFYGEGTPILRIDSFYEGIVDTSKEFRRLKLTADEIEKYKLSKNDIVINRVNGSRELFGKSALVPEFPEVTIFESNMMKFSIDTKRVNPVYIIRHLQSPAIKQQMLNKGKHINQYSVNQGDIRSLKILLPPLSVQESFASRVTKIQNTLGSQANNRVKLERLFELLLHRAFSGDLTAEWRKAHMNEILQEIEHQSKVLGIPHTVEYEQLALSDLP